MFMRRMSTIAVYSRSVEARHIESRGKVAVGRSAHCPFFEFKAESCGNLPCVMKQFHHACRAFERRTVDAAFDCEANTSVKRLEGAHQMLDATRFLHGAEAHVYFHLRLRRNDIAARPPTNQAYIKA